MEKNYNPTIVTLDVAMYEELVAMARTSEQYTTKRIQKHARKFNPFLQPAHQNAVLKNEAERTAKINATKEFFHTHQGKVVYAKVKVYINTDMNACPLMPVIVKRIGKKRWTLEVVPVHDEHAQKYKKYKPVSVDFLQLEIPDGYIQGAGSYTDYLVPENSTYDIREYLAEQERRNEEHRKANKENGRGDVRVELRL